MTEYTEKTWPSSRWPNFSFGEMACKHSGLCKIDGDFMDKLQDLRTKVGFSLTISSGYRDVTHPIEKEKIDAGKNPKGGSHARGKACDLKVRGWEAYAVLKAAMELGFTGVGISQTGKKGRFIHLDNIGEADDYPVPRPALWSY